MLKKLPLLHPILAGIYPIVGLMTANISEVPFHYSLRPMIVVLSVTLVKICILYAIFRDFVARAPNYG